jgi:hypothetical protein
MSDFHAEGYFVITPEWVLDADISDKAVRLYGVLRSYADHRTGVAFPSRRTLAARLHVADPKAVDRAMAELEAIGAVVVERSALAAPGQSRISNRYLLRHTPRGENATPPTTMEDQTASSNGRGGNATRGKYATGVGANTPHLPLEPVELPGVGALAPLPSGASAPRGSGASAPLTTPRELDPRNQIPPSPPRGAVEAEELFDAFWKEYPKKVGKDAARRAWAKALKRTDAHKIIDVVERYPFDHARLRYEKDPATWLNAGCWEDDLEAVTAARQAPRGASGRTQWEPRERGTYTDAGDGVF